MARKNSNFYNYVFHHIFHGGHYARHKNVEVLLVVCKKVISSLEDNKHFTLLSFLSRICFFYISIISKGHVTLLKRKSTVESTQ